MNKQISSKKMIEKTRQIESLDTPRRKLFKLHSWVGFHLALIMSVVLATGTIATISNELDWLVHKELRVTAKGEHVSWQVMTDSINQYDPDSTILTLEALEGEYLAHRARVKDSKGNQKYIYVNQWTGQVTGATGLLTMQRFFRDLHRYLFMPAVLGLPIVTSMAFILAISLYTGLKTSRNWRTLMTRIRVTRGIRVLIGDAHKAFGLWAIWFLMLMIVTSVWYLAEFGAAVGAEVVGSETFEPNRPNVSEEQLQAFGDVIQTPATRDIIKAGKKAYPELRITSIAFPTRANQAITVLGKTNNPILRSRANRVFLNPQNLEPMKVQRSKDIGWVAWINEAADPLHFGSFGGLITKLIWFVFGLAVTALSLSGVWLTWKRTKTKAISKAQYATMPVLIIALLFGYFSWYQQYVPTYEPHSEVALAALNDGSITVNPILGFNKSQQPLGYLRFLISGDGGRPNIKTISASLNSNGSDLIEIKELKLDRLSEVSVAKVVFKQEDFAKADIITINLELNSGRQLELTWLPKASYVNHRNIIPPSPEP